MVILEAIGIASKEIFDYNRENFKFDQEQRLQKDLSRVEMQIKRFDLFRQDIEDLVKLTVDKMDMYHLIGALFLGFTTTIYCEGRVEKPPNWFNGLYLLTVASSFVYLLLAVWLSMHASISSHSFGVRLRTRYVRLPIPSLSQIASLTAKLSDFENQGVREVMRVPFATQGQQWQLNNGSQPAAPPPQGKSSAKPSHGGGAPASSSSSGPAGAAHEDQLGHGEDGFAQEDVVMAAAQALPGKHVSLFRKLQAKWQCYDAYARVSMAMGVHQMLNSLNYYMVGVNLIKWKCPTTAYACTLVFQTGTLAIGILDVAGYSRLKVCLLQLLGSVPICIILFLLSMANVDRDPHEKIDLDTRIALIAPSAYIIQGIWFLLLLKLAQPSGEAGLPRRYRAVLFLDVFGDAAYDPTEAEDAPVVQASVTKTTEQNVQRHLAAAAETSLSTAQSALRRWEAVPHDMLSGAQMAHVQRLRQDYTFWRRYFHGHLAEQQPSYDAFARDKHDLRTWAQLPLVERQEDEFAEALLGPLEQNAPGGVGAYHYNLETGEQIWEQIIDQRVLTLKELSQLVRKAESSVRRLLKKEGAANGDADSDSDKSEEEEESDDGESVDDDDDAPRKASVAANHLNKTPKDTLPWKIIRRMTATLGACWLALGIELIIEQVVFKHFTSNQSSMRWWDEERRRFDELHPHRRLGQVPVLEEGVTLWSQFQEVPVQWPHRGFFQPEAISCLSGDAHEVDFLIGSRYRVYRGTTSSHGPAKLAAQARVAHPPGTTALCPSSSSSADGSAGAGARPPCLLGALVEEGVAVWPSDGSPRGEGSVVLPLMGRPWRSLAGATVRCEDAAGLLARKEASEWCLLLTGWDGERLLVAAAPLPGGPGAAPERQRLAPRLDVPLLRRTGAVAAPAAAMAPKGAAASAPAAAAEAAGDASKSCRAGTKVVDVAALHLDARTGRLWVLFDEGALEAWDLYSFENAGQWRLYAPGPGDFRATALCAASTGDGLLVVGSDDIVGSRLLRAEGLLRSHPGAADAGRGGIQPPLPRSGSGGSTF